MFSKCSKPPRGSSPRTTVCDRQHPSSATESAPNRGTTHRGDRSVASCSARLTARLPVWREQCGSSALPPFEGFPHGPDLSRNLVVSRSWPCTSDSEPMRELVVHNRAHVCFVLGRCKSDHDALSF